MQSLPHDHATSEPRYYHSPEKVIKPVTVTVVLILISALLIPPVSFYSRLSSTVLGVKFQSQSLAHTNFHILYHARCIHILYYLMCVVQCRGSAVDNEIYSCIIIIAMINLCQYTMYNSMLVCLPQ